MNKRLVFTVLGAVALLGAMAGGAYAAFADRGEVKGSVITVGSSDIKLFVNVGGTVDPANLVESLAGPSFYNISQNWTGDYLMKIFNNASGPLDLSSQAYYETMNDPSDLRSVVYIEILDWNDNNLNGILDEGELGTSYGKKTIVKWKTEGFPLMTMNSAEVKGLVLRFSTVNLSDTKQGANMMFDFQFDALNHE